MKYEDYAAIFTACSEPHHTGPEGEIFQREISVDPTDGLLNAELERVRLALADRYDILSELGRGGMAVVYVARDLRHDREVAVKVLTSPPGVTLDPARFAREIRIAAGLTHPGIVPVFDSGSASNLLFYVMPLIRGESLRDRMSRAPALTVQESCDMIAEIADALDAAHRAGVVHRDVKPENILIADGRPLVTDFGVARAAVDHDHSLTATGMLIGTALYMSPEQLDGAATLDGRSDIFALGCILYEMLSGTPPFAARTLPATLVRLATERAPDLAPSISASREVRDVLSRALSRDPADRQATARAFAEELRGTARAARIAPSFRPARASKWIVIGAVILVAVVVALTVARLRARPRALAATPSVAVLPFVNASADTSLEYISDGMTEELQTALGNAGIAVASRDASFAWKNRTPTPQQVTDSLRVNNLIEGSVRQTDDSLRITVHLIDGKTMLQQKSFSVTRKRADIFALQEEVAQAVVSALRPSILGVVDTLVRNRTASLAAYDLTLRAAYLSTGSLGSRTRAGAAAERSREALALADSAIALDSNYAPAWARRAIVLQSQSIYGDVSDTTNLRKARDAAARAVALDERNAESQVSYGLLLFRYEWRWAEAEQHLRRAIALNPRLHAAHTAFSRFLRSMGRFTEARAELATAHALAPAPDGGLLEAARISYFARDYTLGIAETRRGADSTTRSSATWTAQLYMAAGDLSDAEVVLHKAENDRDSGPLLVGARLDALTGKSPEGRRIVDSLASHGNHDYVLQAGVYTALGDRARALDVLEQAVRERDASVVDFKVYPILDELRAEPRFKAMMAVLKFP